MSQVDVLQNTAVNGPKAVEYSTPKTTQPAAGEVNDISAEQKISGNDDRVNVNNAVKNINVALATLRREERHFSVDEDLGRLVVKIINSDTKELVRQIPTEETLSLSKRMQEMVGLLFNHN